MFKEIKTVLE